LENAVAPVKSLRSVKDQADQMSTHTGKDLDYDQYAGLLLSAATNYDMQFASTSSKSTRKVYNTELESSDFAMDSPSEVTEDTDYDIDASATTLLANMTNRGNANSDSYLPSEDYSSLSAEERDLWRKIPPSMKSIILKGRNSGNRPSDKFNSNNSNDHSYKSIKPLPLRGKPFTKANLTELLMH
jgi:hypothetical protein